MKKFSQSTIAGAVRLLSTVLRLAQEEGLLGRNPCRSIRLWEICALRWEDIDWKRQTISVRRTSQRMKK